MSKYIDAEKLIAKIVELRKELPDTIEHLNDEESGFARGQQYELTAIEAEILSLQQEQPEVSAGHGWVARDMNNNLHYFSVEPVRFGAKWWDRDYLSMEVDRSLFGGLTWEDEPIEVEILFNEL